MDPKVRGIHASVSGCLICGLVVEGNAANQVVYGVSMLA
jgi:hypothetical protein